MGVTVKNTATLGLPKLYVEIMRELRERQVVKTWNNLVGDLTVRLVVNALGLTESGNSQKGYDATDSSGVKYQIKGRRLTRENKSTQLSAIRESNRPPFTYLIAVLYDEDFSVKAAYKIPYSVVKKKANYQEYINGYRMMVPNNILNEEGVEDLTGVIRLAFSEMDQSE